MYPESSAYVEVKSEVEESIFRLNLSHFVTQTTLCMRQQVFTLRRMVDECEP